VPAHLPHAEVGALLAQLVQDQDGWRAPYRGMTLRSAFQPVLSITHSRVVGYEALLRVSAPDGRQPPPTEVFAHAQARGEATELDRLTRALHIANFVAQGAPPGWLFLNCLPQVFETAWQHGFFIKHLAAHFGMPHERIVIEVLELPSSDETLLAHSIAQFQANNFLIAIDDFGAGHSNFDRVWRNRPDIVKLDRALVQRIAAGGDGVPLIRHLVAMLHHAGAMVLAEGVETEAELMVLMAADIDFIQGYWLARPHASLAFALQHTPALIAGMWPAFTAYQAGLGAPLPVLQAFEQALLEGARAYGRSGELHDVARAVFALPQARRVFCTDAAGVQSGMSLVANEREGAAADSGTADAASAAGARQPADTFEPAQSAAHWRLQPLYPDLGCNWSRRSYFKQAIAAPGKVAMMGPHFSLTDGKNCYTAALAIVHAGVLMVVCADLIAPPGSVSL
jgi:EAL domain-containing protein (putative c-di-GMP-specific phosphodiesterase class I)